MELRRATQDDAAGIACVHVSSWRVAYHGMVSDVILDGLSVEPRAERWKQILAETSEDEATVVALLDGRVVGFCSFMPSRDEDAGERTAEVAAAYVDPEVWRRGIGSRPVADVVDRLRERGWTEATLWVFARNAHARGSTRRSGSSPTERRGRRTGTPGRPKSA